ncbi:MAG: ATP-binding cassette domain-containing protein [Ideonella sp.]|nr:ATP-binding cassette domain-containing protein [Ideonella sp.]
MTILLEVRDLVRHYRLPRERLLSAAPVVTALQGVSFQLQAGRSLGVVGESGSGKSTLARLVMALEAPTAGQVLMGGRDLQALSARDLKRARADFQMVFQDPFGSLDPRQTVERIVREPLIAQGETNVETQRDRAARMLESVGLRAADLSKYPHEFSGGQRQRIAIARALVTGPKLIVADEPVSALDVSVQAQVLNLMQDLQDQLGVTYLFISHDLAVVDLVCDEVLVLYQGRVVEQGRPDVLFHAAAHPYTRALIDAVPRARPGAERSLAAVVEPVAAPGGCAFAPRCAFRQVECLTRAPALRALADGHQAACHHAERVRSQPVPLREALA